MILLSAHDRSMPMFFREAASLVEQERVARRSTLRTESRSAACWPFACALPLFYAQRSLA